jgi:hypothetical protein
MCRSYEYTRFGALTPGIANTREAGHAGMPCREQDTTTCAAWLPGGSRRPRPGVRPRPVRRRSTSYSPSSTRTHTVSARAPPRSRSGAVRAGSQAGPASNPRGPRVAGGSRRGDLVSCGLILREDPTPAVEVVLATREVLPHRGHAIRPPVNRPCLRPRKRSRCHQSRSWHPSRHP